MTEQMTEQMTDSEQTTRKSSLSVLPGVAAGPITSGTLSIERVPCFTD